MSNVYLRKISNNFQDVRLVSLALWKQAKDINPRDRNGPYIVLQEGYAPDDQKMAPDQFVLSRFGRWLALGHFWHLPLAQRSEAFVFGTAAEVMQVLQNLPSNVEMLVPEDETPMNPEISAPDEMAAVLKAAQAQAAPTAQKTNRTPN